MHTAKAIIGACVIVVAGALAVTSPTALGAEPSPSADPVAEPSPSVDPVDEPSADPPSSGEATIDIAITFDPDGPGPKAARPAVGWTTSIWVTNAESDIFDDARVKTNGDGLGSATVQVDEAGLTADLEVTDPHSFTSLGTSCVDVETGEVVGSSGEAWLWIPLAPGGHYRCDFRVARATGGIGLTAMYEPDGRYNLMRGVDGDPGWVFDVTVRGGYATEDVLTTDWDGMAWASVWPAEGRATARVDVRLRRPAGYRIAEAGCSYGDRRDDGIQAVPLPYQVVARGDRVSLVLDKWRVAQCIYVIVPATAKLPETASIAPPRPGRPDDWPGILLLWVPAYLVGVLVTRRMLVRDPRARPGRR